MRDLPFKLRRQAGNGSYNAAASVVREITVKKPGKSAFFDERRLDPRYEKERTKFARKLAAKKDLKGLIDLNGDGSVNALDAELMFDSDDTDSDGDGMSNFMERAFGGDSYPVMPSLSFLDRSIKRMENKESHSKNTRTHTTRKVSSTLWKPVLICAHGPPQGLLKLISMERELRVRE